MKLLLDADILLDVALDRAEFVAESRRVLASCQESVAAAVIAWHTISNIYCVLRGARNDKQARRFISDLLRFAKIAGGGADDVRRALGLSMNDFEDALQVAVAMSVHAQSIVTRNTAHYRGSPLPAITPQEFIRRFLAL